MSSVRTVTVPRILGALLSGVLVLTGCTTAASPPPAPTPLISSSIASPSTASPAEVSLEDAIDAYATSGSGNLDNITSVIVTVKGKVVTEHYRARGSVDQQTHLWSVTKSVLSTLVGIAVAEGKIGDLDASLPTLLPDHAAAMSRQVSRITLRQLLTMTAGMPGDEALAQLASTDLDSYLALPLTAAPGSEFRYSSASAHLVAAVLTEAVGRPLLDYGRDKLFDPLQIETRPAYVARESYSPSAAFDRAGFSWATTTDGIFHGCCLMKLTGRDMQKLGQLYLNRGKWQGRQIVPASWVTLATSPSSKAPDYGLMWWLGSTTGNRKTYAAVGRDGQIIQVIPDLQAVITVSSWSNRNMYLDADLIFPMITDVILPRIS